MTGAFRVVWDWPALAVLRRLPPRTAAALDRAVIRLAELGEGDISEEPPYYLLRTASPVLLLRIDQMERVLVVLRIYRAR